MIFSQKSYGYWRPRGIAGRPATDPSMKHTFQSGQPRGERFVQHHADARSHRHGKLAGRCSRFRYGGSAVPRTVVQAQPGPSSSASSRPSSKPGGGSRPCWRIMRRRRGRETPRISQAWPRCQPVASSTRATCSFSSASRLARPGADVSADAARKGRPPHISGGNRSGVSALPGHRATAFIRTFSSSRTLPGHW